MKQGLHDHDGISIAATIGRTVLLVGLTLGLMAVVRFCPFMSHAVQHIARTSLWQKLYDVLHISSALGREQLIFSAIVGGCFVLALGIQLLGLWVWRYVKRRA